MVDNSITRPHYPLSTRFGPQCVRPSGSAKRGLNWTCTRHEHPASTTRYIRRPMPGLFLALGYAALFLLPIRKARFFAAPGLPRRWIGALFLLTIAAATARLSLDPSVHTAPPPSHRPGPLQVPPLNLALSSALVFLQFRARLPAHPHPERPLHLIAELYPLAVAATTLDEPGLLPKPPSNLAT